MSLLNPSQVLKLNINRVVFSSFKEEDIKKLSSYFMQKISHTYFFAFTTHTPLKPLLFSIQQYLKKVIKKTTQLRSFSCS